MWWHTRRNQISSFGEKDESIYIGGGRQFSRLLAAEVCVSAVVMLDTPCSEVVWRVLAIHCIRQFPLHFPSLRQRVPSHFNWSLQADSLLAFHTMLLLKMCWKLLGNDVIWMAKCQRMGIPWPVNTTTCARSLGWQHDIRQNLYPWLQPITCNKTVQVCYNLRGKHL